MARTFAYTDQFVHAYRVEDHTGTTDHVVPRERPYCRMYHVLSGGSTFLVEGCSYHAGPGDILLFGEGEICRQTMDHFVHYERVVVNFYPQIADSFDPAHTLFEPFRTDVHRGRHLLHTADFPDHPWRELSLRIVTPSERPAVSVYSAFFAQCGAICSAFFSQPKRSRIEEDRFIQDVLQYLNTHLSEPLNTGILTRELQICTASLYSRFTASVGISLHRYITMKRMSLARSLLAAGHLPAEVSLRCGYTEYSTFYRAFCKEFGMTPSAALNLPQEASE